MTKRNRHEFPTAALVAGFLLLATRASSVTAVSTRAGGEETAGCEDPYPCGDEWPQGLEGPFDLAEVRHVQVPSHDGVMLDGWIASPAVPAGTRTPTVLVSSLYFDSIDTVLADYRDPENSAWWDDTTPMPVDVEAHSQGFPPIRLIRRGYTLAYFAVRGTGSSGGCWEAHGRNEQLDQKDLVDWIAAQPWSNGRVGMSGLSDMTAPTWAAAVEAPSALKAILTVSDSIDAYQWDYSPQGARAIPEDAYDVQFTANRYVLAGMFAGDLGFASRAGCANLGYSAQEATSLVTGDRNGPYWEERSLSRRLPAVKAAVLDVTGYYDFGGGQFQDDPIWRSLDSRTPRVQFRGWWGIDFPIPDNYWGTTLDFPSGTTDWETVVTRWFDYWLKGIGPAPRIGVAYLQDQNLRWRERSSGSPQPSKEVLYLSDSGLETEPREGSTSFHSVPPALDHSFGEHQVQSLAGANAIGNSEGTKFGLCPDVVGLNLSRVYSTPPATTETLISGSSFVYLTLSSDMPGGIVTVELFDIGPDFKCTVAEVSDARWLASGSADLNFYASPYLSELFPVDTPTQVRIDLSDVTYSIAPGHRAAVLLSHGEVDERGGTTQTFPTITIDGSSQIVLPVAEGSFGGQRPTRPYPQRPFTPPGYVD